MLTSKERKEAFTKDFNELLKKHKVSEIYYNPDDILIIYMHPIWNNHFKDVLLKEKCIFELEYDTI